MKVYWSSNRGAVICSANVSANSLGKRGLREAGVWLPRGAVSIDSLLRYAKPQPISDLDLKGLARRSDRTEAAHPRSRKADDDESPSLRAWLRSSARKIWKIGWWESTSRTPQVAKAQSLAMYGVKSPYHWNTGGKGYFSAGDWVLTFNVRSGKNASWMYVDFVVKVPSSEKRVFSREYPYCAVQVHPSRLNPASPPFKLDSHARKVVASAVKEFGQINLEDMRTARLPAALHRLLLKHSTREA
jgi:hypothetical protein